MLKSFGAVEISPVGDIVFEICSRLTPFTFTAANNFMSTQPRFPLNAQHCPGAIPG